MISIIYRAPDESIEGYGVRLEEDDPIEHALGAVLTYYYTGESPDCPAPDRMDAISDALRDVKAGGEGLTYFDLTIDEAKIAAQSLAEKAVESKQKNEREKIQRFASRIKGCTLIQTIVEAGLLANTTIAEAYKGYFSEVKKDRSTSDTQTTSV